MKHVLQIAFFSLLPMPCVSYLFHVEDDFVFHPMDIPGNKHQGSPLSKCNTNRSHSCLCDVFKCLFSVSQYTRVSVLAQSTSPLVAMVFVSRKESFYNHYIKLPIKVNLSELPV